MADQDTQESIETLEEIAETVITGAEVEDTADEAETDTDETDDKAAADKLISQTELDRILQKRLKRQEEQLLKRFGDYDTLKEDAGKFRALEDEQLSHAERWAKEKTSLVTERDAAQIELTKLQRASLVADLASDAGLPKSFWKRVSGESEEDIAEDINSIITDLNIGKPDSADGSKEETPKKKPPVKKVYGGGGETEDPEPDLDKIVAGIPRGPQARS